MEQKTLSSNDFQGKTCPTYLLRSQGIIDCASEQFLEHICTNLSISGHTI